ncbi:MAG: exosortase/archaeosortase family protein [Blastochloris sp.]|nr:exosortase/archaeosortase family protein [Blastochloris sp.]
MTVVNGKILDRLNPQAAAAAGVILLLIAVLYGTVSYGMGYGGNAGSVFSNLWWMWQNTPEWEHCQLVPVVVLGLIYWKREEALGRELDLNSRDFLIVAGSAVVYVVCCLQGWAWPGLLALLVSGFQVFNGGDRFREIEIKGDTRAVIPLVLAMLAYWVGYKIDIVQFSFLSLHFTLASLVVWFFGWRFFQILALPLVFLLFAWPLPFLDALAFKLRIVMSAFSHLFLNVIGIDAIRSGTAILSAPDYQYGIPQGAKFALDVADPCSGIRSLFALTMVTALWSYFTQKQNWKKWALFLCAVPLAVMGNFVRILMLTFGTLLFGSEFAIGTVKDPSFYHMLSGYVVFAVALGGMVILGWLLHDGWKVALAVLGLRPLEKRVSPAEKQDEMKSGDKADE